jgi:hypothetical protein
MSYSASLLRHNSLLLLLQVNRLLLAQGRKEPGTYIAAITVAAGLHLMVCEFQVRNAGQTFTFDLRTLCSQMHHLQDLNRLLG